MNFSDWNDFHGAFLRHPKTSDFEGIEAAKTGGKTRSFIGEEKKMIHELPASGLKADIIQPISWRDSAILNLGSFTHCFLMGSCVRRCQCFFLLVSLLSICIDEMMRAHFLNEKSACRQLSWKTWCRRLDGGLMVGQISQIWPRWLGCLWSYDACE